MSFPAEEDILRPPALQPFEKYAECTVGRESQLYRHLAQALVRRFSMASAKATRLQSTYSEVYLPVSARSMSSK